MTPPPRILLVGVHGYGRVHRERLDRLRARVELVGMVDPAGPKTDDMGPDAPHWGDLSSAFEAGARPDIVIIATPTGTHLDLARLALEHGCDLYLEKPPVASMGQFDELLSVQERTGRAVQVGFQSFGSSAIPALAELGAPTAVAAWGAWSRASAYWQRAAWAGRRSMGGRPVTDGVATNPLAHAVATALRVAGARVRDDVADIELELLHANDIEADDTSALRIRLRNGVLVTVALTLCAEQATEPMIEVRTREVDAFLEYRNDLVTIGRAETRHDREDLLENLLDHRETGARLLSPLVESGAFLRVLEAIRLTEPRAVDAAAVSTVGEGGDRRVIVDDVAMWCERTARAGALFSEAGAPWAVRG